MDDIAQLIEQRLPDNAEALITPADVRAVAYALARSPNRQQGLTKQFSALKTSQLSYGTGESLEQLDYWSCCVGTRVLIGYYQPDPALPARSYVWMVFVYDANSTDFVFVDGSFKPGEQIVPGRFVAEDDPAAKYGYVRPYAADIEFRLGELTIYTENGQTNFARSKRAGKLSQPISTSDTSDWQREPAPTPAYPIRQRITLTHNQAIDLLDNARVVPGQTYMITGISDGLLFIDGGDSSENFASIGELQDSVGNRLVNVDVYAGTFTPVSGDAYTRSQANARFAPLASPALTGTPTAPTAAANSNSTQVATTAYVDRASQGAALPDRFLGDWNPNTQTPLLPDAPTVADRGKYYRISADGAPVSVAAAAGTTNDTYISVSDRAGIFEGMLVSGAGIPAGTKVRNYGGGNSWELTRSVTIAAGAALTFSPYLAGITSFVKGQYVWCDGATSNASWLIRSFAPGGPGGATAAELAGKVDKVPGQGLSTNDYSDAEKARVAALSVGTLRSQHTTFEAARITGPIQFQGVRPAGLSLLALSNVAMVAGQVNYLDPARPGIWFAGQVYTSSSATASALADLVADLEADIQAIPAASLALGAELLFRTQPQDSTLESDFFLDGLTRTILFGRAAFFRVNYTGPPLGNLVQNSQFVDASSWSQPGNAVTIGSNKMVFAAEGYCYQNRTIQPDLYEIRVRILSIDSGGYARIGAGTPGAGNNLADQFYYQPGDYTFRVNLPGEVLFTVTGKQGTVLSYYYALPAASSAQADPPASDEQ